MYLSKILIVDDRSENLIAMKKLLKNCAAELLTASSGNEALSLIIDNNFALILLDVQMPGMDGFETAEIMRNSDYAANTPIIFITAISKEQQHVFKGYDSGAVDYLFKPVEAKILLSKVSVFLELDRQKKELELAREELIRQQKELRELSIKDELTGLYNRRHLNNILQQEFTRSCRYNTNLSCMMLDLDHFKKVNDTYGHPFGDYVLKSFARRLKSIIRITDMVFRFGGEEFIILLPHTDTAGTKEIACKILHKNATDDFCHKDHSVIVTVSIGIASYKEHNPEESNDLIKMSDKALYHSKKNGRNQVTTMSD